jgi:FixJ family two-component response regulator
MPIIFISGFGDVPTTVRAMKAGAVDFLTKPFKDEVPLGAMREAIGRSRVALARASELRALRERYHLATSRERESWHWWSRVCATSKSLPSPATVKAHRGQVMRKMGADSLADL